MSETDYKYITVEHAGGHTADSSTYHRDTQVEAYENKYKSAADSAYSQAEADCNAAIAGKKDATCDIGDKPDPHQYNPKNPEETRQGYKDAADSASEGLVGAAKEMIQIKKDLNDCDNYIYKKMEYATTPDMDFSYTQGYLNDYGKFVNDNVGIDFDKDCVAEKHYGLENLKYEDGKFGDRLGSPVTDVDGYPMSSSQGCDKGADAGGCDADRHSNSVYKTWDENAKDFDDEKQLPTDKLDDPDQEKSHEGWLYGEWFEARKPFTTDGYINVKCDWTDSDSNNLYSLVPSGAVISVVEYKYTHHGQEYYTKKTHITGKFETYFTLSTVGEYGLFDPYVNSGNTCAGDTGNATCVIIIDREITIPPHCNTVVKSGADICEVCPDVNCDNPNVKVTYEFKEVDTSNLFPSQTSSGYPGNYGWNWFSGPNGQTTRNYIESNSRDTFDPRTQLSYSFTLTTSDMREIRAYNRSRTVYGGYTDFVMTCANEGEKDVAKHHCYSKFLEAISGGSGLPYDSKTLSLDTANVDLSTARSKGAWYPSSY